MKKLNSYNAGDVDFSGLYDSVIGEEKAYKNYTKFLSDMGKCQSPRKNLASKERLMNGNLSSFYAFKVKGEPDDSLLSDFIKFAFVEYYKKMKKVYDDDESDYEFDYVGENTLNATLALYKSLLKEGNVVQFRLDSPTDYYDERGTFRTIDLQNATELRTNYYFYILISELMKAGVIEPYTEKLTDHLIFSGTDKHIDDLTYATNLSKKGFANVGKNPVDFGFDPDKFTSKSHRLTMVPRIISYVDQEPILSFDSPIPQRSGEIRRKYRYPGTGLLTIFDFMPDDDFKTAEVSDLSFATRFLFMARSAAMNYWIRHSHYGFDPQYLFSPEEGVYHGVNKGWIDHAIKLAIKYKEYGEHFDLVKVIQFIRATKNENLSDYIALTFSDYDFGDDVAGKYSIALKKAYDNNRELAIEILDSDELKLHQPPKKLAKPEDPAAAGIASGAGQPGEE